MSFRKVCSLSAWLLVLLSPTLVADDDALRLPDWLQPVELNVQQSGSVFINSQLATSLEFEVEDDVGIKLPDWVTITGSSPMVLHGVSLSAPLLPDARPRSPRGFTLSVYPLSDPYIQAYMSVHSKWGLYSAYSPGRVYSLIHAAALEHIAVSLKSKATVENPVPLTALPFFIGFDKSRPWVLVYVPAAVIENMSKKSLESYYRDKDYDNNKDGYSRPHIYRSEELEHQLSDLDKFLGIGYQGELLPEFQELRAELEAELSRRR